VFESAFVTASVSAADVLCLPDEPALPVPDSRAGAFGRVTHRAGSGQGQ